MRNLFLLNQKQMAHPSPHFPLAHGARGAGRRVVSWIIYVIHSGLQWKDAPKANGRRKTRYNRLIR